MNSAYGRVLAVCATSSLTMFNVFLLVMLVWSVHVAKAQQQFDSSVVQSPELASASAAVIQGNDKRIRNLNGVTIQNRGSAAVQTPIHGSPMSADSDNLPMDGESLDNFLVDEEGYWREVKAIIGGVLGFWGGVGGLGTMFLVVVLSQRYCCKKDDDKDDGDG